MFDEPVRVPAHRVTVIPTYQGHYVPDHAYYPRFSFESDRPVEILNLGEVEEFAPGATAQNQMTEVRYFQCSLCSMVVPEYDIETHDCEEDDYGT